MKNTISTKQKLNLKFHEDVFTDEQTHTLTSQKEVSVRTVAQKQKLEKEIISTVNSTMKKSSLSTRC